MERCDVLVVGGGLAGLQCSRLLAQQGWRVLLADRKTRLDGSIHTTGIFVRRTLEDYSSTLPERHLGPPIRHVKLYSPARRTMLLESRHAEFRVGKMGPLYLGLLEDAVQSGVDWRAGTNFLGAEAVESGSLVRLEAAGREQIIHARYVVGADGATSRVAGSLGLSQNQTWIVGVEEVYSGVPLDGPPMLHCFLDPRYAPGYIAWIAHDGEETHVGVGGYAKQFDPRTALDQFRRSVTTYADFRPAELVERRGGRIPVGGILSKIAHDRGLLVGDAAGAVSPLTAGGLDPCLRQAELAARVIDKYLHRPDIAALAPYLAHQFHKRFFLRRLMRRGLAAVRHPWLAEFAFAALRVYPFRALAHHVFFGRGSFPVEQPATAGAVLCRVEE